MLIRSTQKSTHTFVAHRCDLVLHIAMTCSDSCLLTQIRRPCSASLTTVATHAASKSEAYGALSTFFSCSCDNVTLFMHLIGVCCMLCRQHGPYTCFVQNPSHCLRREGLGIRLNRVLYTNYMMYACSKFN